MTAGRSHGHLHDRLAVVRRRLVVLQVEQEEVAERFAAAYGEVAALEAELVFLAGAGAAAAAAWNTAHPVGALVWLLGPGGARVESLTRSGAWDAGQGAAVVLVKGRTLPVLVSALAVR